MPDRNIEVDCAAKTYRIVPVAERASHVALYINHFMTCPNAPIWSATTRKKGA
jgi:hypothetical protein